METQISEAHPDRVEVRGFDLTGDLMGRLSFTEYFHLLLRGRVPTERERFMLDVLLLAIAEHGLMPSNVVARTTYAAAPESLQGAVAAGILGAGSGIPGPAGALAIPPAGGAGRGARAVRPRPALSGFRASVAQAARPARGADHRPRRRRASPRPRAGVP